MKKLLVLYAHPRSDRSEVNAEMIKSIENLDHVTIVDLYAEYPTFQIDVRKEQDRLLDHDVIIFQHPVYWYSCPSLLKEWQDLVLEHGFAYGSDGKALAGKVMLNAVTAGAPREAYARDGALENELRDFFKPFEYTAKLCLMTYLAPFVLYRAGHAMEDDLLGCHSEEYRKLLIALRSGRLDLNAAQTLDRLSDDLDALIAPVKGEQ